MKTTSLSGHHSRFGTTYSVQYVYIIMPNILHVILGLNYVYTSNGVGKDKDKDKYMSEKVGRSKTDRQQSKGE